MVEQSGTALLLEQICNHHEDKIMPLGAFKAALMGTAGATTAGEVVLISSQTANDDSTITFDSGIDATYKEYIFGFDQIVAATDGAELMFQANQVGGSGHDENMVALAWRSAHYSDDSGEISLASGFMQNFDDDAFQNLTRDYGNVSGECISGKLHLFNPSESTFAHHFMARTVGAHTTAAPTYPGVVQLFNVGRFHTGDVAIDDIQFKMNTGNITSGTIKMWGIK